MVDAAAVELASSVCAFLCVVLMLLGIPAVAMPAVPRWRRRCCRGVGFRRRRGRFAMLNLVCDQAASLVIAVD